MYNTTSFDYDYCFNCATIAERKTEYDEIAIHNFDIHLVYVERYPINMISAHRAMYTLSTKSDGYFLVEEIARMPAAQFYDDD